MYLTQPVIETPTEEPQENWKEFSRKTPEPIPKPPEWEHSPGRGLIPPEGLPSFKKKGKKRILFFVVTRTPEGRPTSWRASVEGGRAAQSGWWIADSGPVRVPVYAAWQPGMRPQMVVHVYSHAVNHALRAVAGILWSGWALWVSPRRSPPRKTHRPRRLPDPPPAQVPAAE